VSSGGDHRKDLQQRSDTRHAARLKAIAVLCKIRTHQMLSLPMRENRSYRMESRYGRVGHDHENWVSVFPQDNRSVWPQIMLKQEINA
jgi:hypothetical protein